MYTKQISHLSQVLNWPPPGHFAPHTLVLGSFNPFVADGPYPSASYYYPRPGNLFWPAVAMALGQGPDAFEANPDLKFSVMRHNFACADVIDAITLKGTREAVKQYAEHRILTGFSDSDLWKSRSRTASGTVKLERTYNPRIPQLINASKSLQKIVHTLGKSSLSSKGVYPMERGATPGFRAYVINLVELCRQRGIAFITDCPSPSARAAAAFGSRKAYLEKLAGFFREHLLGLRPE